MKTIGFPISHKEHENRRAIIPDDLDGIKNKTYLFFETGYGDLLGFCDNDYIKSGANIVSRKEVLSCDIVCDPKIGDAEYLDTLKNQTIFGWIHAVQNKDIADTLVNNKLTAYAWEDMYEDGRHIFWRNNELAGEAAIMDAFKYYGKMPYECNVAILGRGNVAQGALKILTLLGANVTIYGRNVEKLFRKEISQYDVIVNCILWDVYRNDHIIYINDIPKMKKNAFIIDISCDRNGGIEFSEPTTIENPVYCYDGVLLYVVDHTPSLFYKTSSKGISTQVSRFVDLLIDESENEILKKCNIIREGYILDKRIVEYQNNHC